MDLKWHGNLDAYKQLDHTLLEEDQVDPSEEYISNSEGQPCVLPPAGSMATHSS